MTQRVPVAGLAVWIVALVLLPAPLAARILLLAPLVVVPRLLTLLPSRPWMQDPAEWTSLFAAVPLVFAFGLAPGPIAGVLALPWLAISMVGLASAIRHGIVHFPAIVMPRNVGQLGIDVALGFWGVGAVFVLIDRLGVDAGFPPVIVLLTAVHFHFAGFGLLGVGALLAVARPWLRLVVLGLILGIPITALGFVVSSDLIGAIGAVVVGSAGIGVAIALLRVPARSPRARFIRAAGAALLVGMPMGIAWSLAIVTGATFLDLETMVRTHGVLNAAGVVVAVMALRRDQ